MDASVTDSNRRVRTRTHGGVAGVRGRPRPLCRSNRLSLLIPAPLPVSESCVRRAVNRPMSAHSPVWLYGMLQMRIVMFFANSDHTHLDHNSAISWARSEAAYHGSNDPWPRSLTPLSSSPACGSSPVYSAGRQTEGKYE